MIERCLEDLERRIDPEVEEELYASWERFARGEYSGGLFVPHRSRRSLPAFEWPVVLVNDALENPERMAIQQFAECSQALAQGNGQLLSARSNFGTSILPSLFGAELYLMEYSMDTLPTSRPLLGGKDRIQDLIEQGVPKTGNERTLAAQALEMGRYYLDLLQGYPKISRYIHIYHPDLQGPIDVCELLWGSALFLDIVDEPELVKAFLALITETYLQLMQEWQQIVHPDGPFSVHWQMLHAGQIMLREDSVMNLSPKIYEEFIAPHDQKLLDAFGGGAVHFCGRGDHYIHLLTTLRGVNAIHLSQPEYNDMEVIFRHTVDRGVKLLDLTRHSADEAMLRGRDLHGCVHCW